MVEPTIRQIDHCAMVRSVVLKKLCRASSSTRRTSSPTTAVMATNADGFCRVSRRKTLRVGCRDVEQVEHLEEHEGHERHRRRDRRLARPRFRARCADQHGEGTGRHQRAGEQDPPEPPSVEDVFLAAARRGDSWRRG
jgi:hypothetical protein